MTYDNFVKIFKSSKYWNNVTVTNAGDKYLSLYYYDKHIYVSYDEYEDAIVFKITNMDLLDCPFQCSFTVYLTGEWIQVLVPCDKLQSKNDVDKLLDCFTSVLINEAIISRNPLKKFYYWLKKLFNKA